jgi:hypothetical protein
MLSTLAPLLIAGSAAIIMLLGLIHLLYTFYGPKLLPRDRDLKARMQEVSLVITRETTMWKAWVGFNASHSSFLLSLGLLLLGGYAFLAKRYWFSVPFRGILLATVCYVIALIINWA